MIGDGRDGGRVLRPPRLRSGGGWVLAMLGIFAADAAHGGEMVPAVGIVGDAVPGSLTGKPGDPARGRAIVVDRQRGLCLLCHSGPFPEERFQGTLAPDLRGAGARWSVGQLRLRMVDSSRVTPDSIMPAYYRTDHLKQVAGAWEGRTVLTAEEIEDVVSFLATLKD